MDSWDFLVDGFFFIAFKDHFFLYSKLSSKSLYMDQMKLITPWYKLIAQAFKHQDLENVLYKGCSCTILKRRLFFFFFGLILKEKKLGLFEKVTRKFNGSSSKIYIYIYIYIFFGKDLEILIFFFFCLFYFGNGQNETKKSVKMHQS